MANYTIIPFTKYGPQWPHFYTQLWKGILNGPLGWWWVASGLCFSRRIQEINFLNKNTPKNLESDMFLIFKKSENIKCSWFLKCSKASLAESQNILKCMPIFAHLRTLKNSLFVIRNWKMFLIAILLYVFWQMFLILAKNKKIFWV